MATKQRGWVAQSLRDIAVGLKIRPDSFSGLQAVLESEGATKEDMLLTDSKMLGRLNEQARVGVMDDAEKKFVEYVKTEFEVEPTTDEVRIYLQLVERKQGILERSKKVEKTAAALQKGLLHKQEEALAQVETQVTGLADLLRQSEERNKMLEAGLARVLQQADQQGQALAILLERTEKATTPPAVASTPPAPVADDAKGKKQNGDREPFAGA